MEMVRMADRIDEMSAHATRNTAVDFMTLEQLRQELVNVKASRDEVPRGSARPPLRAQEASDRYAETLRRRIARLDPVAGSVEANETR